MPCLMMVRSAVENLHMVACGHVAALMPGYFTQNTNALGFLASRVPYVGRDLTQLRVPTHRG